MQAFFRILALLSIPLTASLGCTADAKPYELRQGDWTLTVSPEGRIQSVANKAGKELVPEHWNNGVQVILYAETLHPYSRIDGIFCMKPDKVEEFDNGVAFEYAGNSKAPARVRQEITFERVGEWPTIKRRVTIAPATPFPSGFDLHVAHSFMPSAKPDWFVPGVDGRVIEMGGFDRKWLSWVLTCPAMKTPESTTIALPVVSASDPASGLRLTHVADPMATVEFRLEKLPTGTAETLSFASPYHGKQVPLTEPFTRTFWTIIHDGPPERAMDAWYATALADVPAGPGWLHDVALHEYDYLSHGGRGWFEDIDAAEKFVAPADRGKVVFTLHGWYDMLGRYTYDAKSGKLDDEWTAFPNAPAVKDRFPTSEPVKMSKAEMHRRIRYAKDRGFRVCLYFADGLTACEGAGVFAPDKLVSWGGWQGPDTVGKAYLQNPDHPDVYKWYLDYHRALLEEYGKEIDALVWDETFMFRAGSVAPPEAPRQAYLAPVFIRLVRDLTQATTCYNKDLAFLTSDCQGMTTDDTHRWLDVPPYAIMAHGTYQDSHSRPSVWPYAIFANYRNTVWSCNWQAVTHFDYTRFGVEHYGTPIAITNGWLDDKGIARLDDAQRAAVIELFKQRKDKPQRLSWLTGPAPVFESK